MISSKNYCLTLIHYFPIFRLEVPTMSGKFKLPIGYSQDMECRVLELPFSQRRISMFILLPDDPNKGLETFENNLSTKNIQNLFSTLKVSTTCNLWQRLLLEFKTISNWLAKSFRFYCNNNTYWLKINETLRMKQNRGDLRLKIIP